MSIGTEDASGDNAAGAPDEKIVITPAMTDAGLSAYYASAPEADDEMVANVFRAMFKAAGPSLAVCAGAKESARRPKEEKKS